jgi:hypothetical protein
MATIFMSCLCNEVNRRKYDKPGREMENQRRSFVWEIVVTQLCFATRDAACLDSVATSFVLWFTYFFFFFLTIFWKTATFASKLTVVLEV